MATDRDRQNQMRSLNNDLEQGLQQALEPLGSGPDDNPAKQNVARKTIYTRTELLGRGLPTTQNCTLQDAPSSAALGVVRSTTKSLTEIRSEIDLTVEPGEIKKTPSVH